MLEVCFYEIDAISASIAVVLSSRQRTFHAGNFCWWCLCISHHAVIFSILLGFQLQRECHWTWSWWEKHTIPSQDPTKVPILFVMSPALEKLSNWVGEFRESKRQVENFIRAPKPVCLTGRHWNIKETLWSQSTRESNFFLNIYFYFVSRVFCLNICLCTMCMPVSMLAREGSRSPGTGFARGCELPHVGSGNWIWIVWEKSQCS